MAKKPASAPDKKELTSEQKYTRTGKGKKQTERKGPSAPESMEEYIIKQISDKYDPWANPDLTEDNLAEDIVEQCGRYIRYTENGWTVWSAEDGCWKSKEYAESAVQWIVRHFGRLKLDSATEEYMDGLRHATHLLNSNGINAVMTILKRDKRIAMTREDFDIDTEVVNYKGELYNLRSGEVRPVEPEDYITKSRRCKPAKKKDDEMPDLPTQFYNFMKKITSKDGVERPDLMLWILFYFAYSMTGETGASFFVNFHGGGQNGKSVLLKLMMALAGDYAKAIHSDIVIENRFASPFILSGLQGVRLGVLADAGEGQLNMKDLKPLTTGDKISAPVKFQSDLELQSVMKIAVGSNHRLTLKNAGMDAKRRVRMVPFDYTVPDDEIVPDLEKKLLEEASEIERFLIYLAGKYYEDGGGVKAFPPCAVIDEASREYLESQDLVGRWLEENTERTQGAETDANELFKDFLAWCDGENIRKKMGKNKFGEHLSFHLKEKKHTNKGTVYLNIILTGTTPPLPDKGGG